MSNCSSPVVELSSISTVSTKTTDADDNAVKTTTPPDDDDGDDCEECVLSQGRICICDSCEEERTKLESRKKRKRLSQSTATGRMPEYCQPAKADADMEEERLTKMSSACKTILKCIGEDPSREGLLKTPERWAKALLFMTSGYSLTADQVLNGAVFTEDSHKEIVVVKDIDIHSMCEHHMVPFTGRVHVGYIPNGKIIGLSKIARIAEVFSRRLQVQERLTRQIVDAIVDAVEPLGVGVVIESSHFCMVMRGVQKVGAKTVTSCVRGCFESNPKTRAEFFNIINR